jgi:hypothetical protein
MAGNKTLGYFTPSANIDRRMLKASYDPMRHTYSKYFIIRIRYDAHDIRLYDNALDRFEIFWRWARFIVEHNNFFLFIKVRSVTLCYLMAVMSA